MPLNKLFVSKHHFLEYFMHLSHRWPWYNRKRLHNEVPKYLRSGFKAHFIIANPNPPKGEPQDDHHEGFSSRRLNRRICLTTSFSGSDFAEGEMFGKVSKIALKKKTIWLHPSNMNRLRIYVFLLPGWAAMHRIYRDQRHTLLYPKRSYPLTRCIPPLTGMPIVPNENKTNNWNKSARLDFPFKIIRCFFLPAYGFPNHRNSLKP